MYIRALRLLISLAGVAIVTFVAHNLVSVNATTVGFAYLLLVLLVATAWGFLEAAISSIAATLVYNFFFLPPVGTLVIADPQNWVALFSFLVTALVASRLSNKVRHRALDALERQRDLERLYTFGRAILLIDDRENFANQLANRLAEAFGLSAVVLYERRTGEIHRAGPNDFDGMDHQLHEAALQGTEFHDAANDRVITAIRLGSQPIASLGVQSARMSDSVLQSVANLVAIGLERSRAQELAHEVEVARRSERLRTTLIDAMAHEFKTPLTSIRAATTALLSNPAQQSEATLRMLRIADEEAARLEQLIDNAVDMAQLDSDRIDLDLEMSSLDDTVREVMASMKSNFADRQVKFTADAPEMSVRFDRKLMKLAIKQLLDNALKYSVSSTPVVIRSFRSDGKVSLEITDHGKGISPQDQVRIFERFYRVPSVEAQIPGSGLGLSIAHRIVQAHGGDLAVRSQFGETTFSITLPLDATRGDVAQ